MSDSVVQVPVAVATICGVSVMLAAVLGPETVDRDALADPGAGA